MTFPRLRRVLPFAALVAAAIFFWSEGPSLESSRFPDQRDFRILESAVEHVRNDYVDDVDPKKAMEGAFQGLAGALDALSGYLNEEAAAKATAPRRDRLFDIGVAVTKKPGIFPVVLGVLEGSPAEKAGLRRGDAISALDDRSTLVWSLNEFRLYLKENGPKPVKIRLIRNNDTSEETVERADLHPRALSRADEGGTAGVIRIFHLHPGAAAELSAAVRTGPGGTALPLVLDFRGCHEGEISEARAVLNLFLKTENAGAFVKRGGAKDIFSCPDPPVFPELSLVVWTDPATMGPAEIVAGALQDAKRANVIGTATLGLAAEQSLFPIESGGALLLTTGIFQRASGEAIWGKGVVPDVTIDPDKLTRDAYLEKTKLSASGR